MRKAYASIALSFLTLIVLAEFCLGGMHKGQTVAGRSPLKNGHKIHVLFGLDAPEKGIFPNDAFTVADDAQKTGLRVKLPLPDCSVRVSDCRDLALINVLDGFNLQPRVTVPFDGDIDPASVNSTNAFFVELRDADVDATTNGNENATPRVIGHSYATTWSQEGQFIAGFLENSQHGGLQFLVLSRLAGDKPISFLQGISGLSRFTFPRISPNGKWIAYSSWESGRGETYISSFPSGAGTWQVSTNGGNDPHWHDSKELFYISRDDTLMSVEISEQNGSPVVGKSQPLFRTHRVTSPDWVYDVSPDGSRFLINRLLLPSGPEPITLVVNWGAELKKK
jgi:hypothetical protein